MQQYYTLEEAASKLQMPVDELREMAKTKKVRAFQDRGTWRFRSQDIEELARTRGIGSDAELQLGDATVAVPRPPKSGKMKPPAPEEDLISIDFSLDDKPASGSRSGKSPSGTKSPRPRPAGDSDVRLVADSNIDFQIDADSDVRLEQSPKPTTRKGKPAGDSNVRLGIDKPSDSDVKVVADATDSDVRPRPTGKGPSDSDIRLQDAADQSGRRRANDPGVTEEIIDLDAEEARLAQQKPAAPKKPRITQAANPPVLAENSPFELSDPDFALGDKSAPRTPKPAPDKQNVDSSSDFELVAFDSTKSPGELGSGEIPLLEGDEDVVLGELGTRGGGNSGINLQDPADSGISLESGGSDEIEFELTLDSGTTPKPATPKPARSARAQEDDSSSSEFELSLEDDAPSDPSSSEFELSLDGDSGDEIPLSDESGSDSEFELTLDDEGGLAVDDEAKDIFEPTNFDVPALDDESGSEAVALNEGAEDSDDFEISLDDDSSSESQVVALEDDEEADTGAATVARPRKAAAKSAKMPAAKVEVDESDAELDLDLEREPGAHDDDDDDDEEREPAAVAAAPAEWGPLPALMLVPTVIVLFLVGFMGYELMQGMFGYHRPGPTSKLVIDPIARPIAEMLDAKLPD